MNENDKFIDVKRVIGSKNPKLLKRLPRFVIRYLQKILHEKDVNDFIREHKNDDPIEFCQSVMNKFNITLSHHGIENLPKKGGVVLAINHPLGGMDAMALVALTHQKRSDIKFIVNDVLMHLENLRPLFIGVNKLGKNANDSLKKVEEAFAGDEMLCIFPAGLVSRKKNKKVQDLKWRKTFVTRSKKHEKIILPVYLDGELSNFFYRLHRFRERLGIKANIEMLYLVNELYKQKNKHIGIVFGKPIFAKDLNKSKTDQQWADHIKEEVYKLKKKL
jgi:1-acyl-sn-glycerol-3-phosphate acyltransferase